MHVNLNVCVCVACVSTGFCCLHEICIYVQKPPRVTKQCSQKHAHVFGFVSGCPLAVDAGLPLHGRMSRWAEKSRLAEWEIKSAVLPARNFIHSEIRLISFRGNEHEEMNSSIYSAKMVKNILFIILPIAGHNVVPSFWNFSKTWNIFNEAKYLWCSDVIKPFQIRKNMFFHFTKRTIRPNSPFVRTKPKTDSLNYNASAPPVRTVC